jgi:hypothetical protein
VTFVKSVHYIKFLHGHTPSNQMLIVALSTNLSYTHSVQISYFSWPSISHLICYYVENNILLWISFKKRIFTQFFYFFFNKIQFWEKSHSSFSVWICNCLSKTCHQIWFFNLSTQHKLNSDENLIMPTKIYWSPT